MDVSSGRYVAYALFCPLLDSSRRYLDSRGTCGGKDDLCVLCAYDGTCVSSIIQVLRSIIPSAPLGLGATRESHLNLPWCSINVTALVAPPSM